MPTPDNSEKSIRLDKWLKLSRLCKTRSIATRACDDGKVKVNDEKAKPARVVKIGDVVTIKRRSQYRKFDIVDIVYKNISNKDAPGLYHEHVPEAKIADESKELYQLLQDWDTDGRRKYKGRPTKKERRQIDKNRDR